MEKHELERNLESVADNVKVTDLEAETKLSRLFYLQLYSSVLNAERLNKRRERVRRRKQLLSDTKKKVAKSLGWMDLGAWLSRSISSTEQDKDIGDIEVGSCSAWSDYHVSRAERDGGQVRQQDELRAGQPALLRPGRARAQGRGGGGARRPAGVQLVHQRHLRAERRGVRPRPPRQGRGLRAQPGPLRPGRLPAGLRAGGGGAAAGPPAGGGDRVRQQRQRRRQEEEQPGHAGAGEGWAHGDQWRGCTILRR